MTFRIPANQLFKTILLTVTTVLGICVFSMLVIEPNIPWISSYFTITNQSSKFVQDRLYLIVSRLNLDAENSVPAFLSSINLIIASILLYAISSTKKNIQDDQWKRWRVLSILFFLLALDEMVSLHEIVADSLTILMRLGYNHFGTLLLGIIVGVFFLYYFKSFIIELPKRTRVLFILAGIIYVGGAIAVEGLGGYIIHKTSSKMLNNLPVIVEEAMEMYGIVIFIYALLYYMSLNSYQEASKKSYYEYHTSDF